MNNNYSNVTLTIDDIELDEQCSTFTNCTFEETAGGDPIKGVNFSFAVFNGCTWNVDCIACNFKGMSGDSMPPLTSISLDKAPDVGVFVTDEYGVVLVGDGITTDFEVRRLDQAALEAVLAEQLPGISAAVTGGRIGPMCGIGDTALTKAEFQAIKIIELTTDAIDTADPINGIPDIPADGASSCTILIKKKDQAGNYLTDISDNDTIDLECTRGKLSVLRIDLVNGEASLTLTSIAETCVSEVKAIADGMEPVTIQIQFAP